MNLLAMTAFAIVTQTSGPGVSDESVNLMESLIEIMSPNLIEQLESNYHSEQGNQSQQRNGGLNGAPPAPRIPLRDRILGCAAWAAFRCTAYRGTQAWDACLAEQYALCRGIY